MSSNVIALSQHAALAAKPSSLAALIKSFSSHRRAQENVYWLKENAELLNILECSGASVSAQDLESYAEFYRTVGERLRFFPQYYRFLTSITLDLEALGVKGNTADEMCAFVRHAGLVQVEMSDLQRAEATRLLARRGFALKGTSALIERLHDFMNNSASFALPNRKAAYELTHIVFYLSEYGRRDPQLSDQAVQSLMFTGILAHLDEDADLLSEVCIALRYAGKTPPRVWDLFLTRSIESFESRCGDQGHSDRYHEYFVLNWAQATTGKDPFQGTYSDQGQGFYSHARSAGALRAVSEALYSWQGPRLGDWDIMERRLLQALPMPVVQHLSDVIGASESFAPFFEHFSRSQTGIMTRQPKKRCNGLEVVE